MSNVIRFPESKEHSWNLMEAEFRRLLESRGMNREGIDGVLTEMKGYYIDLMAKGGIEASIPESVGLSDAQAKSVSAAIFAAHAEYNEIVMSRINTAIGIILNLLMQKHS